MKDEQILKKAIEKAVKDGWLWKDFNKQLTLQIWDIYGCRSAINRGDYYYIIFSHFFTKHFWGEKEKKLIVTSEIRKSLGEELEVGKIKVWRYHQHKMLDEIQAGRNPLQYIEKFL